MRYSQRNHSAVFALAAASFLGFGPGGLGFGPGGSAMAWGQVVLDAEGVSLTAYQPTAATLRQGLRPRFDQRGVDIDGTLRSASAQG